MNLAVQLYSNAPSNPLSVPGVWPANVVELGDGTTLPDDTYTLMTQADYLTYLATYQPVYDAWYTSYMASLPVNQTPTMNVSVQNEELAVGLAADSATVTTQFERTDIQLQMARIKGSVVAGTDGAPNLITIKLQVPGTFGDGVGRYVAGGYGMIDTFDPDDFMIVYVEDTDRIICSLLGLATDGSADATVQGMGVLPGGLAAFGAMPNYPVVESYSDTSVPADNQGWYFYPLAQGSTLAPVGEIEVEPLGFYGQIPAQLYLVFQVTRPNMTTGTLRGDIFWGLGG